MLSKVMRAGNRLTCRGIFTTAVPSLAASSGGAQAEVPITRLKVQICGNLYQQWKEMGRKRYKNAPKAGIEINAQYLDNSTLVGKKPPATAILFHGAPGYIKDFATLTTHLTQLGVRVVIPVFPDFSLTASSKFYRHSPEEKLEFAKAILQNAGVDQIDILCTHSCGVYPALRLWKDPSGPEVRSFALFNPVGYETTGPMQPYWLTRRFVKYYQNDTIRVVMDKVGTAVLRATGNEYGKTGLQDTIWAGCSMHYFSRKQLIADVHSIRDQRFPLLIVCADNDKVMNKQLNKSLIRDYGGNYEDSMVYDKAGNLETDGSSRNWFPLVRFRSGGHFAFLKYPNIVNEKVETLMKKFVFQVKK